MHGCSHVQGYIYEQALTPEMARERLATGLSAVARGPRSNRPSRSTTLRRVLLDHQGQIYSGTVRNFSRSGALIEGLWHVPIGTIFQIELEKGLSVTATTRWSEEGKMGVEFATPIDRQSQQGAGRQRIDLSPDAQTLRKAG
jgi:hypothetical protein